ncbi:unnamed protein product [Adineta steineri]|uniref:Uncharacterized protein n=1 Tax=Adineta steineri TaxID=433720 RepID=A0A820G7B3_9BILA|nr:unnamed protein product [Adineta steineri]
MNQIKRQLSIDDSSEEVKKRKCIHRKTITYIENLANELFHEIFDYFDGCELYNTFSNLNIHFGLESDISLKSI